MNKNDLNRKGNQDDHSFRNIYKFEISGLLGNNYDELDDNNLKFNFKSFILKVLAFIIVGTISFYTLKEGMWSTDTRTSTINTLIFFGVTLIVGYIVGVIADFLLLKEK